AYEGAEPYCFVSYAHVNSDRVYPIVEQLMQRGIRLWYDDGIEAGSDFREFIAEKIRDSWQVLLFASHESIQPGFVRNEINYALHCGKPILRVNLDDVELTPGMELSLGGMQYVDATEPGGDYLERIVRTLLAERKEKA
ncbi:MAG: toll/interleukin-1 receptor domain-containing protein, partial [Oscillospiraceae bacterium]|nr:toll/interleukin-1 receptor domain-containing protein [Oscillospiraceae bacterium]